MRSGRRIRGLLSNMGRQSADKHRRGRKVYRWEIEKLKIKEKLEEFQEEMAKDAEQFSEAVENDTYNKKKK